ncbi:MAG: N-6 DNA methylase [Pirellulaceae bacterium]
MTRKKEFGDFQTPESLATKVVSLIDQLYGRPEAVIEPTAGVGTFLHVAADHWGRRTHYVGYEINPDYVSQASKLLVPRGVEVHQRDFFSENWVRNLAMANRSRVLVIGNPPWVTNSTLGQLGSSNLPEKSNFQRLKGYDARTGKSNFDIAEWMLIRLMEALPRDGALAMLCKTMTARKVLRHFWKTDGGREDASLFRIDAKAHFDVAVDACLFFAAGNITSDRTATIHSTLEIDENKTRFGFVDGQLVADTEAYSEYRDIDGGSPMYVWRSGVKHDAAKVMEFHQDGGRLINGYGDVVDIEDEYVFPLLKSSDLGNSRNTVRKAVLVTQTMANSDTSLIRDRAPKTWSYLGKHGEVLDSRKSSIYQKRPRFSVFGVGPYSFAPWKVAISGLYKSFRFVVVPPIDNRPVMVDDTCYAIPCQTQHEAVLLQQLLNSQPTQEFLKSLVFIDSKRPITVDVLKRISFTEVARRLGKRAELLAIAKQGHIRTGKDYQLPLVMESSSLYE